MFLSLLGGGVYVVGSYWLMREHVEKRPWTALLRDGMREVLCVALTQPLLPFYFLLGKTMGSRQTSGRPVVLVHGYGQNRGCFWRLARMLRARGVGRLRAFNYPWYQSVSQSAERLRATIESVLAETGATAVDLVCHSMGGIVALEYLHSAGEYAKVRRCVTVASPHDGVRFAGPIPGASGAEIRRGSTYLRACADRRTTVPVLSIFSNHDNVVPPASSSMSGRGGRDLSFPSHGHLSLLFSPEVAQSIAEFLREPDDAAQAPLALLTAA